MGEAVEFICKGLTVTVIELETVDYTVYQT